jgi:hypothetical protein
MRVAQLRQKLCKAHEIASSLQEQMRAIERRLEDELSPLRLSWERTKVDLKRIEEELNELKAAPSKQQRLEPQLRL